MEKKCEKYETYCTEKLHISKLNSNIDLFSNQKIEDVNNSNIILIIYLNYNSLLIGLVRNRLVKIINSNYNLNVTVRQANLVKMNVLKDFIKRRNNSNLSLLGFIRNTKKYDLNIKHFSYSLRNAGKKIREQLLINMNDSRNTQHVFKKIIDEFDIFYNSMQIEDYDLSRFV